MSLACNKFTIYLTLCIFSAMAAWIYSFLTVFFSHKRRKLLMGLGGTYKGSLTFYNHRSLVILYLISLIFTLSSLLGSSPSPYFLLLVTNCSTFSKPKSQLFQRSNWSKLYCFKACCWHQCNLFFKYFYWDYIIMRFFYKLWKWKVWISCIIIIFFAGVHL